LDLVFKFFTGVFFENIAAFVVFVVAAAAAATGAIVDWLQLLIDLRF
jgi:hypothetical protein